MEGGWWGDGGACPSAASGGAGRQAAQCVCVCVCVCVNMPSMQQPAQRPWTCEAAGIPKLHHTRRICTPP
eukprot:1148435-Pelagomonas_calceolata.AAC.5